MFFSSKLRVTFAAAAISTAAMACGGSPDQGAAPAAKQTGTTYSAKASAKSQAALQVTRWHSTIESGVNGAIVLDGQDRVGRVKYLQTAFIDKKTQTLHLQVILPQKGEMVVDLKHQTVLSNTLSASVQPYARGIYYDFQAAHPLRGGATQAYSYLSAGLKVAAGAAVATAGAFVDATILGAPVGAALNYVGTRLIVAGVVDAIYTASGDKIAKDEAPAAPAASAPATSDDPTTAAKDAVDQANPGASPPETPAAMPGADPATPGTEMPGADPAKPGADPAMPGADPAMPGADPAMPSADPAMPGSDPAMPGSEPAAPGTPVADATGAAADGAALPAENTGGNLDNVDPAATAANDAPSGGSAASDNNPSSDSNNTGGDSNNTGGASNNSGGDSNNSGGDSNNTGGDSTGGDSTGGAEAAHICRKVAVSATTKLRACVHY